MYKIPKIRRKIEMICNSNPLRGKSPSEAPVKPRIPSTPTLHAAQPGMKIPKKIPAVPNNPNCPFIFRIATTL